MSFSEPVDSYETDIMKAEVPNFLMQKVGTSYDQTTYPAALLQQLLPYYIGASNTHQVV